MMTLTNHLLLLLMLLTSTGCVSFARTDGPYGGKVIDADTSQPIVGAVVFGVWNRAHPGAGGASHTYYDSREVLTDQNGEFNIPGQGVLLLNNLEEIDITIFKVGYEELGPRSWESLRLSARGDISWKGSKPIIRLKRLTMEERRKRYISMTSAPIEKQRLLRKECNKESIELGRPTSNLYPEE